MKTNLMYFTNPETELPAIYGIDDFVQLIIDSQVIHLFTHSGVLDQEWILLTIIQSFYPLPVNDTK